VPIKEELIVNRSVLVTVGEAKSMATKIVAIGKTVTKPPDDD
jgi:hypothetical protein